MTQEVDPHQTLDLGLASLQNCERYISVSYKIHNPWYFVAAARMDSYTI